MKMFSRDKVLGSLYVALLLSLPFLLSSSITLRGAVAGAPVNGAVDNLKFRFKDCAMVNKGFYKGCVGEVRNFYTSSSVGSTAATTYYDIDGKCKGERFSYPFAGEDLDLYHGGCAN